MSTRNIDKIDRQLTFYDLSSDNVSRHSMPSRLLTPSKVSYSPVAKRRDRYFDTNSGFSFALEAMKARMLNTVRVDVRLVIVIITVSKFDIMTA